MNATTGLKVGQKQDDDNVAILWQSLVRKNLPQLKRGEYKMFLYKCVMMIPSYGLSSALIPILSSSLLQDNMHEIHLRQRPGNVTLCVS